MPDPAPSSRPAVLMVNAIKFWGGGEQWYWQVAEGLRDRGFEVGVAGRKGGVFLERFAGSRIPLLGLSMRSDYGIGDVLAIRRWLAAHAPAVVFCNLSRDARLTTLARLGLSGVRVVWVMGSILIRDRWRDRSLVRRGIDRILLPSGALASELAGLDYIPSALVSVVPIGIDLTRWMPGARASSYAIEPTGSGPVVGVFGRLETRKGHRFLLEAWPQVLAQFPGAELRIVGTGSQEQALRAMAGALGIAAHVRFEGFQTDVQPVMGRVDLVAQPSLYEPFGITLLEAMASGKPVICTTAGGMPEVVDADCARLVPPGDSAALGAAIAEVLADRGRQAKMGSAGRKRAEEQFALPRMIDRVASVIAEVMR